MQQDDTYIGIVSWLKAVFGANVLSRFDVNTHLSCPASLAPLLGLYHFTFPLHTSGLTTSTAFHASNYSGLPGCKPRACERSCQLYDVSQADEPNKHRDHANTDRVTNPSLCYALIALRLLARPRQSSSYHWRLLTISHKRRHSFHFAI